MSEPKFNNHKVTFEVVADARFEDAPGSCESLHEALCRAIHEEDCQAALQWLNDNVTDISISD